MKKVAIIQNRIQPGGRMQVIIAIIGILNEMGIEPEIVTLRSRLNADDIKKHYGADIQFSIREIFTDLRLPFEWHILFFNWLMRFYYQRYDLLINSNNTSFLLPKNARVLSYVHFPRKARLLSPLVSLHFPDGPEKSWLNPGLLFINLARLFYTFDKKVAATDRQIANSDFSRQHLLSVYDDLSENKVPVIYPPVPVPDVPVEIKQKFSPAQRKCVVSLGRFAEDKRQLEQIRLAAQLPDFEFHLIGFAGKNNRYFESCRNLIAKQNIKNVVLHGDAGYGEMQKLLSQALFFVHSLRNEPFGITAVQAIASGCIPLVHDSGGQKEVVTPGDLRYSSESEAVGKLQHLVKLPDQKLEKIYNSLYTNIRGYANEQFRQRMKPLLEETLES